MTSQDKSCLNKRRFDTIEEITASIEQSYQSGTRFPLYTYRCKFCQKWHKTKHDPDGWRRTLGQNRAYQFDKLEEKFNANSGTENSTLYEESTLR